MARLGPTTSINEPASSSSAATQTMAQMRNPTIQDEVAILVGSASGSLIGRHHLWIAKSRLALVALRQPTVTINWTEF